MSLTDPVEVSDKEALSWAAAELSLSCAKIRAIEAWCKHRRVLALWLFMSLVVYCGSASVWVTKGSKNSGVFGFGVLPGLLGGAAAFGGLLFVQSQPEKQLLKISWFFHASACAHVAAVMSPQWYCPQTCPIAVKVHQPLLLGLHIIAASGHRLHACYFFNQCSNKLHFQIDV